MSAYGCQSHTNEDQYTMLLQHSEINYDNSLVRFFTSTSRKAIIPAASNVACGPTHSIRLRIHVIHIRSIAREHPGWETLILIQT